MNDQDYIRKAVELADGFSAVSAEPEFNLDAYWDMECDVFSSVQHFDDYDQPALDALAAQLVRQVNAIRTPEKRWEEHYEVIVYSDYTEVGPPHQCGTWPTLGESEGPDRTMNTIKAIVDSGVLE